eukprot:scaffold131_cov381-Pinguiococcus_pyrenoidosus.AAC.9
MSDAAAATIIPPFRLRQSLVMSSISSRIASIPVAARLDLQLLPKTPPQVLILGILLTHGHRYELGVELWVGPSIAVGHPLRGPTHDCLPIRTALQLENHEPTDPIEIVLAHLTLWSALQNFCTSPRSSATLEKSTLPALLSTAARTTSRSLRSA